MKKMNGLVVPVVDDKGGKERDMMVSLLIV
jgi:hypothetical protein